MSKKTTIDRGAVMRAAHRIRRERGIALGDAMRIAWAEARTGGALVAQQAAIDSNPAQQPGGLAAGLRRYGVSSAVAAAAERLADRAAEAVERAARAAAQTVAGMIASRQQAALPRTEGSEALTLTRRADGSFGL